MTRTALPKTMHAAVYHGADDLRVEQVPVPDVGPGDVLVRVAVCGVSSADVKRVQLGLGATPRVLGTEIAGVVEVVGAEVDDWRPGDRVVVHETETTDPEDGAGGGYAEFVLVPRDALDDGALVEIPRTVSFEEAIFLEPVNTCLRGIRLLDIDEDDLVFVAGVGSLGLILLQLAIREGSEVVAADPIPQRLELAASLGAARTIDPRSGDLQAEVRGMTRGRGADAAIVAAVGAGPVRDAIRATRPGAKILLFGQVAKGEETAVDVGDICLDEKHLIGSHSWDEDLADESDHIVFHREVHLAQMITHRFPLADAPKAFHKAAERTGDVGKVVILPPTA